MGYDFKYLLYFRRENMWEVLGGLGEMAQPSNNPDTIIHFPNHDLALHNMNDGNLTKEYLHDAKFLTFSNVFLFDEDNAILQYEKTGWVIGYDHSLQENNPPKKVGIGTIYLWVHTDLEEADGHDNSSDLVLFEFVTTGTRMSLLFQYSTSIRKAFTNLLERFHGVCGIFYNESEFVELFWFKGKPYNQNIPDAWMPMDEIENLLTRADDTSNWGGY
jgi:hypothetical protein